MNNNQGRRRVRRAQKKSQISRILLMIVMMALVAVVSVGGTIAWLTDKTQEVKNTFTTTNIDIELAETATNFEMVPGVEITKDPIVTYKADSEDGWLFVEIFKSTDVDFDAYMTYDIASGWTLLEGDPDTAGTMVYYREVTSSDSDQQFPVLDGNKVTVRTTVTNEMMDAAEAEGKAPVMTFTAYAIQKVKFDTVEDAWTEAKKATIYTPATVTP
ncbi:MAG: SipW-dependent-type signal peptide-containing protein [Clostridia bacterium]|nr:SipW-dependent-type signal peptide-containing protein [Clostridia bacterium]